MESQDHASRNKSPHGRTRRGHAPKRVARRANFAANLWQNSGFCGKINEIKSQISWATSSGTPRPSAPINITCSATYRVVQRRAKGQKLGFSFVLSSSFVIRVSFYFQERERFILSVTPMYPSSSLHLYSAIKVIIFSFVHCSDILFFFLFSFLFLCDLLWLLMNMQVDSKSKYN